MMDCTYHVLKCKHNTIGLLEGGCERDAERPLPLSCAVARDARAIAASLRGEMRVSVRIFLRN